LADDSLLVQLQDFVLEEQDRHRVFSYNVAPGCSALRCYLLRQLGRTGVVVCFLVCLLVCLGFFVCCSLCGMCS
jgi:hypothetical protein